MSLVLTACDSLNRDQLLLRPSVAEQSPVEDRITIAQLLSEVAESKGFKEKHLTSTVQDTVVYFEEDVEYFPIYFGARRVGDDYVVDLSHFHPGPGETDKYKQVKELIIKRLEERFSERIKLMPKGEHIAIVHKVPPNQAPKPTQ